MMAIPVKILVAEDEIAIGDYYKVILESRNHQVALARDGEECIKIFNRALDELKSRSISVEHPNPFDLVVLDFRMPKKDGIDVAKHILSKSPRQKIIFTTAYTLDTLDGIMKKMHLVTEVIQKPFDLDAFAAMIEDFAPPSTTQSAAGEKKLQSPTP
jgi:CheY-like chemotaxis protein